MDKQSLSVSSIRTRRLWLFLIVVVNAAFVALLHPSSGLATATGSGGGVIWGTPQLASTTAYWGAFIPVLAADSNGRLLMVYNQSVPSGGGYVENPYYRQSTNGGRIWSQPAPIYSGGLSLLQATIEFDNQNQAHAIWRTEPPNSELWHSREDQWPNAANQITSTLGLIWDPDMAIDTNGAIHVVWAQENSGVYYSHSEDGGNSWSGGTRVSDSGNTSRSPAIAVDYAGSIHVVWEEKIQDCCSLSYEVHYASGNNASQVINWSVPSELLSEGLVKALQPDIMAEGENIHVAFARREGTETNVSQYAYYMFKALGSDWSEPIDISHDPLTVHSNVPMFLDPTLVPCEDSLNVYFHGAPTEFDNEVIVSAVNTDGWAHTSSADVDNARAIRPSVVCLGGKIHMVYEKVIIPNQDHQIYYISGNRFALYIPFLNK